MKSYTDNNQNKSKKASDNYSKPQQSDGTTFQFVDNRTAAVDHRKMTAAINLSQKQVAQRQLLNTLFGHAAQLQSMDEEELQMKIDSAALQRTGPEEEELLQGQFETAQRQGDLEDEELFQGKFGAAPIQRERDAKTNDTGLPDNLKAGIENLSGYSMDDVSVHFNSPKPAQLQAHAYAQGTDIHLASGQEKHLPHEAWHVVQQKQGRVKPTLQMKAGTPVNDDPQLENEADVMGERALQLKAGTDKCLIDGSVPSVAQTPMQLQVEKENASPELFSLIDQLEQLQSEAQKLGKNDDEAPDISELSNKLAKLREIASGNDEHEKAEVLKALHQEIPNGNLPDAQASAEAITDQSQISNASPLQKQSAEAPIQRFTGLEIGLIVGGIVGIGALAIGIYKYIKRRKAEAIFTEFGNRHRRRDFDPDVLGEWFNGIHQIQGQDEGARPEDAPVVNEFRVSFHKLHSVKLYMEKNYPDLFQRLGTDFNIDIRAELLRISAAAKTESKSYKKRVKDLATDDPIEQLQQVYALAISGLGIQALTLAQRLQQIINTETDDDKDLDEIHSEGTDIWRDTWHRAVMAVNTVLHGRWPHWKGRLKTWTAQKRNEGLNYMDPNQIIGLDYIGSLARGYKGPPKQAVRFMPEKFDVDANLTAPPLAAYALTVGNAMVDRGRIWSNQSDIALLGQMETDIQQHLVDAGLENMGMDPNEPFEAVIDAEGVRNLVNAPVGVVTKKATSERDQLLRDRIFWARHRDMNAFNTIGAQLQGAGLAALDDGHLVLREHDEENQTYAYSEGDLNRIEDILVVNGA
jgi:hypothetical protein